MPKPLIVPTLLVMLLLTIAVLGVRAREALSRNDGEPSLAPRGPAEPGTTEVTHAVRLPPQPVRETLRAVLPAKVPAAHPADDTVDEPALMRELREMRQSDPELSLRLARQGNERFPTSPDAAERASIIVKSLMRMGRAEEATAEARAMVEEYPGTPWATDVRRHMLDIPSYHP